MTELRSLCFRQNLLSNASEVEHLASKSKLEYLELRDNRYQEVHLHVCLAVEERCPVLWSRFRNLTAFPICQALSCLTIKSAIDRCRRRQCDAVLTDSIHGAADDVDSSRSRESISGFEQDRRHRRIVVLHRIADPRAWIQSNSKHRRAGASETT